MSFLDDDKIIDFSNLKSIQVYGQNYYYVKNDFGSFDIKDENLNNILYFHGNEKDIKKELETIYKHDNELIWTVKNLVYNNCAHIDYYEKDMKEVGNLGYPPFPCQRRSNMKELFYNNNSCNLFNNDIFDVIKNCEDKKEFEITFKTKKDKYILHSIQIDKDCFSKKWNIQALFFIKKSIWNKYSNNVMELFEQCDSYDKEYYVKEEYEKDVIFVIPTNAVEEALENLFDCNKHMLKGYKNKTITIK